ncbi:hypothetical protein EVAR_81379_1 [Eumeta japonica]|uniref:Uncharacterized protein n=1 Tax=Eumeta variegata TaxID=151549 RepID=A0A4C1WFZ3_EUMVA|nr:hypothetical protein EVAR_81379_1 [Eumeta japonica]
MISWDITGIHIENGIKNGYKSGIAVGIESRTRWEQRVELESKSKTRTHGHPTAASDQTLRLRALHTTAASRPSAASDFVFDTSKTVVQIQAITD